MRWAVLPVALMVVDLCRETRAEDPPPYNSAILKYCESKMGKRVGSGECSHLANEALRTAGAEFTQVGSDGKRIPDSPKEGDYVWGTLVKSYSFDAQARRVLDSDAKAKCQAGDILQFRNVKTADGAQFPHHTAIVRTVDASGLPTGIYQQNVQNQKGGDGRIVQKSPLAIPKMVSGQIWVYRADKASNPAAIQFTWTNNTSAKQVEFTYFGKKGTLGTSNTADGYRIVWGTGRGADSVTIDGTVYTISTRKAYEFFNTKDGKVALREVE